jgi:hypothetical protein
VAEASKRRYNEVVIDTLSVIDKGLRVNHSSSSLFSHLIGTFEILEAWEAEPEICLAGLIHSIYSTQYFTTSIQSVRDRRDIARRVGDRAERLAYLFCKLDRTTIRKGIIKPAAERRIMKARTHLSDSRVSLAQSTVRALRLIDTANEIEQCQRWGGTPRLWFHLAWETFHDVNFFPPLLRPIQKLVISVEFEKELWQMYCSAIKARGSRREDLLTRCVAMMPLCGEAQLLLSVQNLEAGNVRSAYANARLGSQALAAWGAAWDTRVSLLAWEHLGQQTSVAARNGSVGPTPFARQVLSALRHESVASRRK